MHVRIVEGCAVSGRTHKGQEEFLRICSNNVLPWENVITLYNVIISDRLTDVQVGPHVASSDYLEINNIAFFCLRWPSDLVVTHLIQEKLRSQIAILILFDRYTIFSCHYRIQFAAIFLIGARKQLQANFVRDV